MEKLLVLGGGNLKKANLSVWRGFLGGFPPEKTLIRTKSLSKSYKKLCELTSLRLCAQKHGTYNVFINTPTGVYTQCRDCMLCSL